MKKIFLLLLILIPISVNAKTVKYLGQRNMIVITVDESSISASINGKKNIEINNLTAYQNVLLNDNKENYPIYILNTENGYEFSNKREKSVLDYDYYTIYYRYGELNLDAITGGVMPNTCNALFGYNLINLLKNNVFKIIYFSIPVLLIVLTTLDFFKCIFSDDNKEIRKSFDKLTKRIVATVLIFLTPTILTFLIQLVGSDEIKSCVDTFSSTENIKN